MTRPVIERLMEKVTPDEESGCWNFTGCLKRGYGYVWLGGGSTAIAHRVTYEHHVGPIPDGLHLDHLCRNRSCVNPAHLEAVTPGENTARSTAWEFHRDKTHCPQGHAYSPENTWVSRRGDRNCRACSRARKREWAARNAEHVRAYEAAYRARRGAA